jgi:hypothetical protein
VNDDFTQGLGYAGDHVLNLCRSESRFERCNF